MSGKLLSGIRPHGLSLLLMAMVACLVAIAGTAQAVVLISDDFNDGSIDTTKWWPRTDTYGGANVQETGGVLQMISRGYLNTLNEYDPTSGGLRISGTWTFANVGGDVDMLQIITRTTGAATGSYGETNGGIEFHMQNDGIQPSIQGASGSSSFTFSDVVKSGSLSISQGDTIWFDIYDYGNNSLSFTVTGVGGAHVGQSASVTATISGGAAPANYVTFHNREGGGRTANLDDVVIQNLLSTSPTWQGGSSGDIWGDGANWSNWTPPPADPNGQGVEVVFGDSISTGHGAVTLDGDRTVGAMNFLPNVSTTITAADNAVLTLDNAAGAAQLTIAGTHAISAPLVLNSDIAMAVNLGQLTLDGIVSDGENGAKGIAKSGYGLLFLTNVNTFTGKSTFNGGTLRINADSGLGTPPADAPVADQLTLSGGTLMNNDTDVAIAANRGITLGAGGGGLQAGWSKTLTINSIIAGPGALTIQPDSGWVELNADNSFTGGMNIRGNVRAFTVTDAGTDSSLGNSGDINFNVGTLQYIGLDAATNRKVVMNGGGVIDHASALDLTGIVRNGQLTKTGDGVMTLGGTEDNDSLRLNAAGGTVVLAKTSASSVHAVAGISAIASGARVQLAGSGDDQIYDGDGFGVNLNGGTFDVNGRNEGFNVLSGSGTVTNDAADTTGVVTVGTSGGGGDINVWLTDGAGSLGFTKTGGGEILIANTGNTYSGKTVLLGGVTRINGDGSLGAVPAEAQDDNITLDGGGLKNNDSQPVLDVNRGITLGPNGGYITSGWGDGLGAGGDRPFTIQGKISGSGELRINQDGSPVVLTNPANSYAGNTLIGTTGPGWPGGGAAAWLQLGASDVIPHGPDKGNVNISGDRNGVLDLNGYNQTVNGLTGTGTVTNTSATASTLTVGDADAISTFEGPITDGTGAVSLQKIGSGTLTLLNGKTYSGATIVNGGTLKLAASAYPASGLLGEWTFDGGTANDSSGNGYNGTAVNNPTFDTADTHDGKGQALVLNGSNQYVAVDTGAFDGGTQSIFRGTNAMTISAWVKGWPSGGWNPFICKNGEPNGWQMRRYGDNSNLSFTRRNLGNTDFPGNTTIVSDGNWHMVTMTFDSTVGSKIYVDGQLDATDGNTGTISGGTSLMLFGARDNGGIGNHFAGKLDDIYFYSRALTAGEIAAAYNGTASGSNVLPIATALLVGADSTLDLNGVNQQVASLSDSGSGGGRVINDNTASAATLTLSSDNAEPAAFSGMIEGGDGMGTISLLKSGEYTQILTGDNTYTGGTTVNAGTLEIGGAGALPAGQALTIGAGGTVVLSSGSSAPAAVGGAVSAVPEPGTLALLAAAALAGLAAAFRRYRG